MTIHEVELCFPFGHDFNMGECDHWRVTGCYKFYNKKMLVETEVFWLARTFWKRKYYVNKRTYWLYHKDFWFSEESEVYNCNATP